MAIRRSLLKGAAGLRRRQRGFTLIELMIVVAIIGILAVLAIYGVSRYLKSSKTAEATNNLGAIAKNASESLNREMMSGAFVAAGGSTSINHCVCESAVAPVPGSITAVKGQKYSSDPNKDWRQGPTITGEDQKGWRCLKFTVDQPQYYMYDYKESNGSCEQGATTVNDDVHAYAYGDLDGNGTSSQFDLEGKIENGQTQLTWAPKPNETAPEE